MELADQPAETTEGTGFEHYDYYLPAMPSRQMVVSVQRLLARLDRF